MASVPDVLDDYWLDDLTANLLDEYVGLGGMGASFTQNTGMACIKAQHVAEVPKRDISSNDSQIDDSSSVGESGLKSRRADPVHGKRNEGDSAGTSAEAAQKSFSINKATREKLRRERLNERFAELGMLLNLKGANVDKLRVLSEAIHVLKSLREEMTQLKNTNNRLHLANTMTSEMAVSLLKVQQRDGDQPNGKCSPDELIQEDTFQEPAQSPSYQTEEAFSLQERERYAQQMMKAQQLQNDVNLRNDAKRKRLGSDSNTGPEFQQVFANAPNKLANVSHMGWPMNTFPQNMTMNMWMPASAQDISQDHILRPPVA
uniref:BHLH domain-containing protein n=1 Tax=Pyramimonas obovata TaxID=1411642 RepID=A0A7S0QV22_9CHLO|mmetsp:Transcript_16294/g.35422  ORF Transcript_16294/g.35422 Transcript_16294/m.35422 type:complete len:317 (+) Transcript_16294:270-1220(+)|eukprot:CAMPEP_0118932490 /NCGR_PEP_ID=MMETSP1169-20130426/10415_1 /TAXON_ID=36882 /ORGANISM="Pyramimonas obovata, Strain CCMP722" /LENGTH=316 /DNA_ID=CAMNT_0006875159 /DNA_START=258 /DNA_END=1208 /DNA_ORIENTATION=+